MADEQLWIDKAKQLLDTQLAKDKEILAAAGARKETRKATGEKLEAMLAATGRAKDPKKAADTEALRAAREETFLHRTSEKIEQGTNAAFVAEDLADIVADGNVRQPPVRPGILNAYATEMLAPVGQRATWRLRDQEYADAMNEYNAAQVQRGALQVTVGNALADIKVNNPDRVTQVQEDIKRKNKELGKPALSAPDLDAATDQQIKRTLVFNEIDAEIRLAVAAYDAKKPIPDPETRLDKIAKIIENIGEKYGFTNLAHFISRHGATRINPYTGESKRTGDDFVSRMATGVGPDRKSNPGATVTAPRADGTNVTVPSYADVGYETALAASQHASAKAALFMIEEAMAEAALVDELTGGKSSKMDVVVGKEDIDGQKLGSYEEPGKLGRVWELKGTAGVPKLSKGQRGKPLAQAEISQRIGDTKVTPDQPSAKVGLLAAKMLGGYNVMTMMSVAQVPSAIEYEQGGTQTLAKTSAAVEAKRKAAMIRVRDELLLEKNSAEGELATKKGDADTKAKGASDAGGAVDIAIGKLDAPKQDAARNLKKLLLEEVAAAQSLAEAKKTAKGLDDEAKRLKARMEAAQKDLELKKNAIGTAKTPTEKEDAEYEHTVANMAFEELGTDATQLDKLLQAETKKRDTAQVAFDKAEAERKDAESKAGLTVKELGDLKGLFTELEKKQNEAAKAAEARDTAANIVKFYAEQHADAVRQVKIADLGIAEVVRLDLEQEAAETKAALVFDSTKESASEYDTRLKAFEDGQRSQIEEQRKRLQADMKARAEHAKEVRDEVRPLQSDLAGLIKRIEKMQQLIDNWQSKADGLLLEREKIAKDEVALQAEYKAPKEKKGEDHSARLAAIEQENESLRNQGGALSLKRNTALNNVAQLRKKQKEFQAQTSSAKADETSGVLDKLRLTGGLATIDRAEAELELRVAEAKANLAGASNLVKVQKEAATLKKTLMEAKAALAAAQLAEQEAKTKYEKLKAVEDRIDKLVADGTLPPTEPRVVDLKNRIAPVKLAWDNAKIATASAEKAVNAATVPYEAKAKEVGEKAKAEAK